MTNRKPSARKIIAESNRIQAILNSALTDEMAERMEREMAEKRAALKAAQTKA